MSSQDKLSFPYRKAAPPNEGSPPRHAGLLTFVLPSQQYSISFPPPFSNSYYPANHINAIYALIHP